MHHIVAVLFVLWAIIQLFAAFQVFKFRFNSGCRKCTRLDLSACLEFTNGRYKIRIGEKIYYCNEGDFAYLPSKVPHAFLNLTDEPGEIIVVYTPGGGHKFYEESGSAVRNGKPDPKIIGPLFEKYDMTLLGPPLSPE